MLQRGGAFKFRGAYNFLAQLTDAERARGVIAPSSGNHAQAVALAAKLFNVKAVVVMPTTVTAAKRGGAERLGARVELAGTTTQDRMDRAVEIGPYNRGGAWLVPAADAQAAIRRETELRQRVAILEEQLENLAIADFVRERVATASGRKLSGIEFVRSLGFDQIADEIEAGRQPAA